ncbi:MAG: hypothetical protein HON90_12260 [Halobacteriovoraceae bacterium]|jgi:glycerophosphoryl diester phosphodiesterase|nr:hypothetical protein [Halobacteriovoraceae bacterium]
MKIIFLYLFLFSESYASILISHRGVNQNYHRTGLKNDTCTASRINSIEHDFLENTIESIEAAFNFGADMVELDIHPTTEINGVDELVVFHDYTLDCRTEARCDLGCLCSTMPDDDDDKKVCITNQQSLNYIQSLDIGYGYTADNGQTFPFRGRNHYRVPTFTQVLDVLINYPEKTLLVNVKAEKIRTLSAFITVIKEYDNSVRSRILYPYSFAEGSKDELVKLGVQDQINQKDEDCLVKYLKTGWYGHFPKECHHKKLFIPIRQTLERVLGKPGRHVKFTSILWGWPEKFIKLAHNNGTKVYASQVDSLHEYDEMIKLDLDGIMTNKIELIGPYSQKK